MLRNKAVPRSKLLRKHHIARDSGAGPTASGVVKMPSDRPRAPILDAAAPPLQELVFGDSPLAAGHLGGPVLLGDDRLVLVKVLDRHKPELKPVAGPPTIVAEG